MIPPTLSSDRLILRTHVAADLDAYASWLGSDRARFMGGPFDRQDAWSWFASDVAQWPLLGFGGLAVTDRTSGRLLGQVSIIRPPHFPEPKLGWIADAAGEGRGLMSEAAGLLRDWASGERRLPCLVSYIHPGNARSIALAERLGATVDRSAAAAEPGDLVFRHRPAGRAAA